MEYKTNVKVKIITRNSKKFAFIKSIPEMLDTIAWRSKDEGQDSVAGSFGYAIFPFRSIV
jgi:hypothetical protein